MPQIPFGEWLPDRGPVAAPGLRALENLAPVADGYQALPDFEDAGMSAIDADLRGAARGRTQSGADYVVAGTDAKLFLAASSATFVDESISGGYALGAKDRWEFALYGNRVIAVCASKEPQDFNVGTSEDFENLSADASYASVVETVEEFVVLGDIQGRGVNEVAIGSAEAGLHWSAIGDPTSWPQIGSADATTGQSDFQILQGEGGRIRDIVAAAEYTAILRDRQVWRMDYVGPPTVFNFRKIDDRRGALLPGCGIAVGNLVYFPSDSGFMAFDGAQLRPIGHEKVDRTWRALVDRQQAHLASAAHWPRKRMVLWTVPNSGGNAMIFAYHYELDRWSQIIKPVEWLVSVLSTGGGSLDDAPQATQSMDADAPTGLGDVDLDTLQMIEDETFAAFLDDHKLHTATSPNRLTGRIELGDLEAQRRVALRGMRPVFQGDGSAISGYAVTRMNAADTPTTTDGRPLRGTGVIPIRATGRYLRMGFRTSGDVTSFQGVDPIVQQKGRR